MAKVRQNEWNKNNYDHLSVYITKDEDIKKRIANLGCKQNAFIKEAIFEKLKREEA